MFSPVLTLSEARARKDKYAALVRAAPPPLSEPAVHDQRRPIYEPTPWHNGRTQSNSRRNVQVFAASSTDLPMRDHKPAVLLAGHVGYVGSQAGLAPFNIACLPDFDSGTIASKASPSVGNDNVRPMQSVVKNERAVRLTLNAGVFEPGL